MYISKVTEKGNSAYATASQARADEKAAKLDACGCFNCINCADCVECINCTNCEACVCCINCKDCAWVEDLIDQTGIENLD